MSTEQEDRDRLAEDESLTEKPILWHVQYADESRDCDGTYPLTAHYVLACCQDDAENRASEDFDMSEGTPTTGPFDTRPATEDEIRRYSLTLTHSPTTTGPAGAHQ